MTTRNQKGAFSGGEKVPASAPLLAGGGIAEIVSTLLKNGVDFLFILIILAPPVVKCWILSATYVHTCLITLRKQTLRNLLWVCSHFVVTKNHPDNPKVRRCRLQKDAGPSAGLCCAGRADNERIHQQRCCKHDQTPATRTAFIAPSTVKWNLGFGSLSRLISPGCSDLSVGRRGAIFPAAAVAWKQRCCAFCAEKSSQLASENWITAVVFWISFTCR